VCGCVHRQISAPRRQKLSFDKTGKEREGGEKRRGGRKGDRMVAACVSHLQRVDEGGPGSGVGLELLHLI